MSCKKLKAAQCWLIRQRSDWALIIVSNETGLVSIDSSYGRYTNTWHPAHIGEGSVLEFVIGLNFDYAMGKFIGLPTYLDSRATVKMFKEQILECRRCVDITAEAAREYWGEMRALEDHDNLNEFHTAVEKTEFANWCDDWWEYGCMSYPPQAVHFWDNMWPEFVEAVKAELAEPTTEKAGE